MKKSITLIIKTYKIPCTIEDGKVVQSTFDLTDDMIINSKEITLDPTKDNLQLKIPEESKKVGTYNKNQEKITLQMERDYIHKQILTKQ